LGRELTPEEKAYAEKSQRQLARLRNQAKEEEEVFDQGVEEVRIADTVPPLGTDPTASSSAGPAVPAAPRRRRHGKSPAPVVSASGILGKRSLTLGEKAVKPGFTGAQLDAVKEMPKDEEAANEEEALLDREVLRSQLAQLGVKEDVETSAAEEDNEYPYDKHADKVDFGGSDYGEYDLEPEHSGEESPEPPGDKEDATEAVAAATPVKEAAKDEDEESDDEAPVKRGRPQAPLRWDAGFAQARAGAREIQRGISAASSRAMHAHLITTLRDDRAARRAIVVRELAKAREDEDSEEERGCLAKLEVIDSELAPIQRGQDELRQEMHEERARQKEKDDRRRAARAGQATGPPAVSATEGPAEPVSHEAEPPGASLGLYSDHMVAADVSMDVDDGDEESESSSSEGDIHIDPMSCSGMQAEERAAERARLRALRLDQSHHDGAYYEAIKVVTHSVAWADEKKRRRASQRRAEGFTEASQRRADLEREWHDRFDQSGQLKASDYSDKERVGDDEALEGIETEVIDTSGTKLRVLSGAAKYRRVSDVSPEEAERMLKAKRDREYREMTQAEKQAFKDRQAVEAEIKYFSRIRADPRTTWHGHTRSQQKRRLIAMHLRPSPDEQERQVRKARRDTVSMLSQEYPDVAKIVAEDENKEHVVPPRERRLQEPWDPMNPRFFPWHRTKARDAAAKALAERQASAKAKASATVPTVDPAVRASLLAGAPWRTERTPVASTSASGPAAAEEQELTKGQRLEAAVRRRIEAGRKPLTIYERIKALYEEHVPGKLGRLNLIWAKYKGDDGGVALYQDICKKYGVTPVAVQPPSFPTRPVPKWSGDRQPIGSGTWMPKQPAGPPPQGLHSDPRRSLAPHREAQDRENAELEARKARAANFPATKDDPLGAFEPDPKRAPQGAFKGGSAVKHDKRGRTPDPLGAYRTRKEPRVVLPMPGSRPKEEARDSSPDIVEVKAAIVSPLKYLKVKKEPTSPKSKAATPKPKPAPEVRRPAPGRSAEELIALGRRLEAEMAAKASGAPPPAGTPAVGTAAPAASATEPPRNPPSGPKGPPVVQAFSKITAGDISHLSAVPDKDGWLVANLDTGAAATVFPRALAEHLPKTKSSGQRYRTASGEVVYDEGGAVLAGKDANHNRIRLSGRVVDVSRPLVAGTQVARHSDLFYTGDHGAVIPREHPIAQGMRECYRRLCKQHGQRGVTPLREEDGVIVFDYQVEQQKERRIQGMDNTESAKEGTPAGSASRDPAPSPFRGQAPARP